jgi:O-antigen/teichoic acid export membrane protein
MSVAANLAQPEVATFSPTLTTHAHEFRSYMASISRQSSVYFVGMLFTAAAGCFFKVYLARTLGAPALGLYALGMTIIGFIGVFNSLGLPAAATRFVAAYSRQGQNGKIANFVCGSVTLLAVLNIAFAVMVLMAGPWLASHFYHAPQLGRYLWAFAVIMMVGVLNMFLGQVMAGYRDVAGRTLITHFIGTPANIILAILLITLGFGLSGYMAAQVVSSLLIFTLLVSAVVKNAPAHTRRQPIFRFEREVVTFSIAAYGMAALQFVLAQADTVVLGHYLDAKRVGIYAVAMGLVGLVPVVLDSVNQIFSPLISELHAARNPALLEQLYSTLTKWILILTFPLALSMMVFAAGFMSFFGAGFRSGASVLVIGVVGEIFNCGVGSVGYLLLMSGNQGELIRIQAVNAALLVALNVFLVPRFGITGAAFAVMLTTSTTNLWALASVRRRLGIFPYHAGYCKLIWPAVGAAAATMVLARWPAGLHKQWEIAGAGLITAYSVFGGIALLLGLDQEDRTLAKLAWARAALGLRKAVTA